MQDFIKRYFGARVVKTSIAAGLALSLASLLHFPGYTYAAMVAVLATQKSLSRSFGLAKHQLISAAIGTLGGNLVAWQFGSHPLFGGLLVYLLFVIHLRMGWTSTILMSVVTGINSLSTFQGEFWIHALMQLLIVVIGISCSILVNLFMIPRYGERIEELTERAEGMLRGLLYMLHNNLLHIDQPRKRDQFEQQVKDVRNYIQEARHYAELIIEDQRLDSKRGQAALRASHTLEQMDSLLGHILNLYKAMDKVDIWVEPIPKIQKLLRVIIEAQLRVFHKRKVHHRMIERAVNELDQFFAHMELPKNRLEFMTRAALYHFYEDLKDYYADLKIIDTKQV